MKKVFAVILLLAAVAGLSACAKKEVAFETVLLAVKEAVVKELKDAGVPEENFENGIPGIMEADILDEESYIGISNPEIFDRELIEEGVVLGALFNIDSTEIILLKAKDKKDVDALEESLYEEKANRLKLWETYLPQQHEKVKNTIIKTDGRYLLYVTFQNPHAVEDAFDAALSGK